MDSRTAGCEAGFCYSALISSQLLSWDFTAGGDFRNYHSWGFPNNGQDLISRSISHLQQLSQRCAICKFIHELCPQPLSAIPSLSTLFSPSLLRELLENKRNPSSALFGEPCSRPSPLPSPREAPALAPGPTVSKQQRQLPPRLPPLPPVRCLSTGSCHSGQMVGEVSGRRPQPLLT